MTTLTAVVLALLLATPVFASDCPNAIRQARAALEQFKKAPGLAAIKDAKIAAAETNLKAAQSAHDGGEHGEAMQKVKAALDAINR
jgi:hypothetical protein